MRVVKIFAWAGVGPDQFELGEWIEITIPDYIEIGSLIESNFIDHHVFRWKDSKVKSFWEYEQNMANFKPINTDGKNQPITSSALLEIGFEEFSPGWYTYPKGSDADYYLGISTDGKLAHQIIDNSTSIFKGDIPLKGLKTIEQVKTIIEVCIDPENS